jgi:hypothetical protein
MFESYFLQIGLEIIRFYLGNALDLKIWRHELTWRHAQHVISLRVLYKFSNFNSTLVICLKCVLIEMLDIIYGRRPHVRPCRKFVRHLSLRLLRFVICCHSFTNVLFDHFYCSVQSYNNVFLLGEMWIEYVETMSLKMIIYPAISTFAVQIYHTNKFLLYS